MPGTLRGSAVLDATRLAQDICCARRDQSGTGHLLCLTRPVWHRTDQADCSRCTQHPPAACAAVKHDRPRKKPNAAHLGAPEVSDAEHELQDAVAARDDCRVRYGDGAAAVLWMTDAGKDDANHDSVHDQAHHRLNPNDQPRPPAVTATTLQAVAQPFWRQGPGLLVTRCLTSSAPYVYRCSFLICCCQSAGDVLGEVCR